MLTRVVQRQVLLQVSRSSSVLASVNIGVQKHNLLKIEDKVRQTPVRTAKRVAFVENFVLHKDIIDQQRREAREAELQQQEQQEVGFDEEEVRQIILDQQHDLQRSLKELDVTDMPLPGLPNPYSKPHPKCILCEQSVQLDFKNTRLLSQFVSPHTGQIYGRHATGLCLYMQNRVSKLIKRARYFGFMPYLNKEPKYLADPKLFDPFKKKY